MKNLDELRTLLDNSKCALSGAIDRVADDGAVWRNYVKGECKKRNLNIRWFDPCDKPNGLGSETSIEKTHVRELIIQNKWEEAKDFVKEFRRYDLRGIDWSDFVIVKIDLNVHLCGTYNEIFIAERQGKPIFVIMGEGQKKTDIPTWLISFINPDEIFESEDDCLDYLEKINQGVVEMDRRWVKID